MWSDKVFYVSKFAVGTFRTKSLHVVLANFLIDVFWPMPKLALIATNLTESSLVEGTRLLLLRGAVLWLLGMPVDTLRV